MNTPLEVMKAIVENGGPIEAWVRTADRPWIHGLVVGVTIGDYFNPFTVQGSMYRYKECALTDPNKKYAPLTTKWTFDWARYRAINHFGELWEFDHKPIAQRKVWHTTGDSEFISEGHDPSNWKNSLEERPRKTRPMTAREVYDYIMHTTPMYRREYNRHTSSLSFEKRVWLICEPDKDLANEVMKIADVMMQTPTTGE